MYAYSDIVTETFNYQRVTIVPYEIELVAACSYKR